MPYINPEDRVKIDQLVEDSESAFVLGMNLENAGELNYFITMIIRGYMNGHGMSYQRLNDIVGALEGAKAEYQRRIVGPYEDRKRDENGDVYNFASF